MELSELLGPSSGELEVHHMLIRAFLAYIISFIFFRVAGLRTFGKMSFCDNITVLTLGAIIGRAIVTTQPFFPSMAAVLFLVTLHRLTTWASFKNHSFGKLIKGEPVTLIKNGKQVKDNMAKSNLTKNDLEECIRLTANIDDIEKVKLAFLERSGDVSVIKAD